MLIFKLNMLLATFFNYSGLHLKGIVENIIKVCEYFYFFLFLIVDSYF